MSIFAGAAAGVLGATGIVQVGRKEGREGRGGKGGGGREGRRKEKGAHLVNARSLFVSLSSVFHAPFHLPLALS
jgi:hypothetical protein